MKFKLELVQGHHMNPALEVVVTWTPWTVIKRPICLLILDAFSFLIKFNKWPTIFVSILIFVDSHRLSHSRIQSSFFFFFQILADFHLHQIKRSKSESDIRCLSVVKSRSLPLPGTTWVSTGQQSMSSVSESII